MTLLKWHEDTHSTSLNGQPLGFDHALHDHAIFAGDSVQQLVRGWPERDFFVAAGAPAAGSKFYSTDPVALTPSQAFDDISHGSYRILLKRLERHSLPFRELLSGLLTELFAKWPTLHKQRIIRLESFLFISSAATITPFHFDPEIGFFFQVRGEKTYHLYSPSVLSEQELEKHYVGGGIDIGQVDFERRRQQPEYRFALRPGSGLHQPAHAPHWVETQEALSISYSFALETDRTRAMGRTRAFNGLCRRLAIEPSCPGQWPVGDAMKSSCMHVVRPLLTGAQALRRRIA